VQPRTAPVQWADGAAIQGLLAHWQQALVDIGFLDPAAPKKLLPRLNQLANRAQLTQEEVHILRGIARAMQKLAAAGQRALSPVGSGCPATLSLLSRFLNPPPTEPPCSPACAKTSPAFWSATLPRAAAGRC
jgi:hypothetical protein